MKGYLIFSLKPNSIYLIGARRHSEWGQKALSNMIEICLNPENETLRSDAFTDELDKEEIQDSREMTLKTAQRLAWNIRFVKINKIFCFTILKIFLCNFRLLFELNAHHTSDQAFNHRLLGNFWLLATNQKSNIEKAQQDFALMATQDLYKDHVGLALGIATAYMLQVRILLMQWKIWNKI